MKSEALRLAIFNPQVGTTSDNYFVGLPIPAAAGVNAAFFFDNDIYSRTTIHHSIHIGSCICPLRTLLFDMAV
ncbi:MAG: hypothetical protein JSU83_13665 [Deltaproteobacteria bacterium]|nr:MAG: hypothetical protein JSU83_13665 [Deltaproteobacteria bacterium]